MTPEIRPAYLEDPFGISTAAADQRQPTRSTGGVGRADAGVMFLAPSAHAAHHHTASGPVAGSNGDARTASRQARNRWQR